MKILHFKWQRIFSGRQTGEEHVIIYTEQGKFQFTKPHTHCVSYFDHFIFGMSRLILFIRQDLIYGRY